MFSFADKNHKNKKDGKERKLKDVRRDVLSAATQVKSVSHHYDVLGKHLALDSTDRESRFLSRFENARSPCAFPLRRRWSSASPRRPQAPAGALLKPFLRRKCRAALIGESSRSAT